MADNAPVDGIPVHRLVNDVTAVSGLLSVARRLQSVAPDSRELAEALEVAHRRAVELAEVLARISLGTPLVIDLTVLEQTQQLQPTEDS